MDDVNGTKHELLDRLAADATPVAYVGGVPFAVHMGLGAAASAAIIVVAAGIREDLAVAISTPIFGWKLLSMLGIALASLALLHRVGRPGAATGALAALPAAYAAVVLAAPLALQALVAPGDIDFVPAAGPSCVALTSLAAVPVWIAALSWLRNAAPTDLRRASWAAGLASASVAATLFALHCPYDSIAYVALWYGAAIAGIAGVTRLVLPRFIRW